MRPKAIKKYLPRIIFIVFSLFLIWQNISQSPWKKNDIIQSDVFYYYTYLPAAIINKDPFFRCDDSLLTKNYGTTQSPSGGKVVKMSMGVAFMDLPFFLVGHLYALSNQVLSQSTYPANGYSIPYQFMISFSSVFYTIMGLFFLWKFLKIRHSKLTSIITVLCIGLGTNLYFYSMYETGMSHPCTFFLLATSLYLIHKWLIQKTLWRSFLIGIFLGLIVLVRPINILFILPIVLIFKDRAINWGTYLKDIFLPYKHVFLLIIGGFLIVLPQLIFWKVQTGDFIYYSYNNESFFWLHPHIWEGLFSFRKGWFIYTPIMFFALFGLFRLYKTQRSHFWAITIFLPLFLYVTFSWWCWWYGGGFGARTLIDILPLMALPLAGLIDWIVQNKYRSTLLILPCVFICLNLYQTWQYATGIIHYDSMTWKGYKTVFLKSYTPHRYWKQLQKPDYKNAREKGREEISDTTETNITYPTEADINAMIDYIISDKEWMNSIKKRALKKNQDVDSMLRTQAEWALKNR